MNHDVFYSEVIGGITAPRGFVAGGLHCGIRKSRPDLAIISSVVPASVAGVFTMNKAQAAPVIADKWQLRRSERCSAIVINSGNANACTGERGLNDAWMMVRATARALGVPEEQVLVSSTGVIGQYLPIERITDGIARLAPKVSRDGAHDAALAIMTTDTYPKEYAVKVDLGSAMVTIGAMAKGSGMIAPNMATVLGFITTDALIATPVLDDLLRDAADISFNRVSVDGDTSTNDMVLALANGVVRSVAIVPGTQEYERFKLALEHVMIRLAKMVARDGEGATKLIEVVVEGATTEVDATAAARSVANSNLVKTAIHGEDANWGRILAAIGYSGIEVDPEAIAIALGDVPVLEPGYRIVIDEDRAKEVLSCEEVVIRVDLGSGAASARFWTCDLTKQYVHINASYRT